MGLQLISGNDIIQLEGILSVLKRTVTAPVLVSVADETGTHPKFPTIRFTQVGAPIGGTQMHIFVSGNQPGYNDPTESVDYVETVVSAGATPVNYEWELNLPVGGVDYWVWLVEKSADGSVVSAKSNIVQYRAGN
jgi:hypothetical protein